MIILDIFNIIYEKIINAIAIFSSHIPPKIRNVMIYASIMMLLWNGILYFSNNTIREALNFEYALKTSIVMIAILLVASIKNRVDIRIIRFRPVFWFGWIVCFSMMLVTSLFRYVTAEYVTWCATSLLVFPALFIVWKHENKHHKICRIAARFMLIMSILYIIASIVVAPFIPKNTILFNSYVGMAPNPNSNGLLCTAFFAAALFLLLTDKNQRAIYSMVMGISIAISVIAKSRASMLSITICTILGVSYSVLMRRPKIPRKTSIKSAFACILIICISGISSGYVLNTLEQLDLSSHAASVQIKESGEAVETIEQKLNKASSGRIKIWEAFISETTFFGNGCLEEPLIDGYKASMWAHNNALDILYISGVIPFIGYVLWIVSGLLFIVRSLRKKDPFREETLFAIIMFAGYFIEAMLEITLYPQTTDICTLAYFGIPAIAFKEQSEQ